MKAKNLHTCKTSTFARLTGYGIRKIERLRQDGIVQSARHGHVHLKESLLSIFKQVRGAPDAIKTASELRKLELEVEIRQEKLTRLRAETIDKQAAEQYMRDYAAACAALHSVDLAERMRKRSPDIEPEILSWCTDQLAEIREAASVPVLPGEIDHD